MNDTPDQPTIQELFERDPSAYDEDTILLIINELREKRKHWAAGNKSAGNLKKKAPAAPKLTKAQEEVKSLGLTAGKLDLNSLLNKK